MKLGTPQFPKNEWCPHALHSLPPENELDWSTGFNTNKMRSNHVLTEKSDREKISTWQVRHNERAVEAPSPSPASRPTADELGGQNHYPDLGVRFRATLLSANRREHDAARLPSGCLRVGGPVAVNHGVKGRGLAKIVLEFHAGFLESHLRYKWVGEVGVRVSWMYPVDR